VSDIFFQWWIGIFIVSDISGKLVIYGNPVIFVNYLFSFRCWFSQLCLRLLYQRQTAKYFVTSVADHNEVLLTGSYCDFPLVFTDRISSALLSL
jgi:hypothetical protein